MRIKTLRLFLLCALAVALTIPLFGVGPACWGACSDPTTCMNWQYGCAAAGYTVNEGGGFCNQNPDYDSVNYVWFCPEGTTEAMGGCAPNNVPSPTCF
jgi:hypothetical protein